MLPVNGTYVAIEVFAIDWIRVAHGADFDGTGTKLTDYKAFGARIYAVAPGTVTSSKNNRPEAPLAQPPTDNPFVTTADEFPGNNVIEKIGPGEYAVYAHLQPGSVRVRAGQRIRAGQTLGLLGNSGNSTAPHLHFSLQDGPNPLTSNSPPGRVRSLHIAGKRHARHLLGDRDGTSGAAVLPAGRRARKLLTRRVITWKLERP